MNERLAVQVRQRFDGAWELLATAAGNPDAVQKCCEMLSRAILDDFVHPDWMIEERVEALSAFDPRVLASLANEWPKPVRSMSPLIRTAWRVGLRHLFPILRLDREDFEVPELAEESAIFWQQDVEAPITWEQAFELVNARLFFDYTLIRRLALRPLIGPFPSHIELARSPAWMLPLLRGHVYQLEPAARDYLGRCGRLCLGSELRPGSHVAQTTSRDIETGNWTNTVPINYIPLGELKLEGNASAAPPIIELCREIGGDLVEELGSRLAEQLQCVSNPRLAAPLVYLLLSSWSLP